MAVTPIQLFPGTLLANAAATLYSGPATTGTTKILQITVCNTDTLVHTFSLWIGTNATATLVIDKRALAPGETQSVPEAVNLFVGSGIALQMDADTASVVSAQGTGVLLT